jgi:hypothetical protein
VVCGGLSALTVAIRAEGHSWALLAPPIEFFMERKKFETACGCFAPIKKIKVLIPGSLGTILITGCRLRNQRRLLMGRGAAEK